jgi:hypothetical protein
MLEMCEKAQSAKAAAADAAPGDGGASGQVIEKRVVELEAAVAALKATNKELQQRYSDAFYKGKQSECENLKLQQKIEALQKQQRSVPPSTRVENNRRPRLRAVLRLPAEARRAEAVEFSDPAKRPRSAFFLLLFLP